MVVPFTLVVLGQWLSQGLSLREIKQEHAAAISTIMIVVALLPAMMGIHSKVPPKVILPVIGHIVSVTTSFEIGQSAGRRCVVCVTEEVCV